MLTEGVTKGQKVYAVQIFLDHSIALHEYWDGLEIFGDEASAVKGAFKMMKKYVGLDDYHEKEMKNVKTIDAFFELFDEEFDGEMAEQIQIREFKIS